MICPIQRYMYTCINLHICIYVYMTDSLYSILYTRELTNTHGLPEDQASDLPVDNAPRLPTSPLPPAPTPTPNQIS